MSAASTEPRARWQAAFAARFRERFGREPTVNFRLDLLDDSATDSKSVAEVLDMPFLDEDAPPPAAASVASSAAATAAPPKRVFVQIMLNPDAGAAGFPSFHRAIMAPTNWDVYVEVEAIRFARMLGSVSAPAVDAFMVDIYDDMPAAPGRFYDERVLWCLSDRDDTEE
jgi:hypothetical protein